MEMSDQLHSLGSSPGVYWMGFRSGVEAALKNKSLVVTRIISNCRDCRLIIASASGSLGRHFIIRVLQTFLSDQTNDGLSGTRSTHEADEKFIIF
jgi:hypothetical protein